MGAQGSKNAASGEINELASHYSQLVDSMVNNQLVFDVSAKNIARTEQEWFRKFEEQMETPPVTEDALYRNIFEFMNQSGSDAAQITESIGDPGVRESARNVLSRTRTSVHV